MKIAMWSGPRNLSTAMMYAFAQRDDCTVVDEPFYAAYLAKTGLNHPMRDAILASQETDPVKVIAGLTAPHPKPVFYQKHMTQHMLPGFDLGWALECRNVFLIRHPARVVASYDAKREMPTLGDLGFRQQLDILETLFARGADPIVIDSYDIRKNPKRALRSLCRALGLDFQDNMLRWTAGPNPADGVWAAHWYGAVHRSTGFAGAEGDLPKLDGALGTVVEQAMPFYEQLAVKRLGARRTRVRFSLAAAVARRSVSAAAHSTG